MANEHSYCNKPLGLVVVGDKELVPLGMGILRMGDRRSEHRTHKTPCEDRLRYVQLGEPMNASIRPATRDDLKPGAELLAFLSERRVLHITLSYRAADACETIREDASRSHLADGPGWVTSQPLLRGMKRVAEASLFQGIDAGVLFVIERVFHGIDATPDPKDARIAQLEDFAATAEAIGNDIYLSLSFPCDAKKRARLLTELAGKVRKP